MSWWCRAACRPLRGRCWRPFPTTEVVTCQPFNLKHERAIGFSELRGCDGWCESQGMDENAACRMMHSSNACRYWNFDSLCPQVLCKDFPQGRPRLHPSSQPPLAANSSNYRRPWDLCGTHRSKLYLLGTGMLILLQKVRQYHMIRLWADLIKGLPCFGAPIDLYYCLQTPVSNSGVEML